MALSSFVYVSNIDNLSDARFAAGMGVDLLGFKLDPNDATSLNNEQFHEISEWISGVKIVGEFGDSNPEAVKKLLNQFNVDYLLISDESQLHDFSMLGLPLIYKLHFNESNKDALLSTINYCSGAVDYFLLESDSPTLSEAAKNLISSLDSHYPLILGYGFESNNVLDVVGEFSITGICLKGSPELRPGYKEFDELADILEALEIE